MTYEVIMPKLGETMEEGYLVSWKKEVGEKVEKGEVLFEVMSDKTNFEVESTHSGYLRRILYPPSDQPIPVTTVIAYLTETPDEPVEEKVSSPPVSESREGTKTEPAAPFPSAGRQPAERIKVSPRAKKLAEEKGVQLSAITGSGPEGRIVERDVINYLEESGAAEYQVISWTPIRKVTAERLSQSKATIPHYYLQGTVRMEEIASLKDYLRKEGQDYTYTDFIVFYCAQAMKEYLLLNAALVNNEIRLYREINIGLAVALEEGLVVPVIKSAARKTLKEISAEIKSLTEKARKGQLTREDTSDCRFVISNLGMYQVENFQPIINPPGVAIMGVGAVRPGIVFRGDSFGAGLLMKLSLSLDHRVIDGAYAGRFFQRLKAIMENPGLVGLQV
ncbi:MAG: 2-oxo acid dehydrogenase subunit E2 [Candidatus Omnitrophica bacterium]|nr:2-oxo acid dehydrogenase subunit E2 [Candidatus Omnitrophota bacterium]